MRKITVKKTILAIGLLVMLLTGSLTTAFAANDAQVALQVEQTFSVTANRPETIGDSFNYTLYSSGSSQPMPQGAGNNEYSFTLKGNQKITLPAIAFNKVGPYQYTLKQKAGSAQGYTYDAEVYTIEVYVANGASPGTYKTTVLIKNSKGEKVNDIVFANSYQEALVTPTPVPQATSAPTAAATSKPSAPPYTGDDGNLGLWIGLTAIAVLVLVVLVVLYNKNKGKQKMS